jgi:hypothetical protein
MELFTGLEANCLAGRNLHLGASSWVATDAGLSWFNGKNAESAELDPIARDEGALHALEDSVYRGLCFCSWQAGSFNHPLYEILLDHFWAAVLGCKFWYKGVY